MRMLPFFQPKKGFMIAGGGLETSSGGGGGGGGSVHYSTEPRIVGKWYDGRDCYEVTIVTTSNSIDVSSYNIDEFYCVGGYTKFSSGNRYSQPYSESGDSSYFRIQNATPNTLTIASAGTKTVFTIRYAQNTD